MHARHGDGGPLRRHAAHTAEVLASSIDRMLADRPHGRSSSIAPRKSDGSRPVVFTFNANGGGH